ncbi:MAG: hypothetical protein R2824_25940 [Saprospiraceae bacterium]|nr:hypothetical protein [Lewinella sp.]
MENLFWEDLVSDHSDWGDEWLELSHDPEAGVVAAVGIFTMLKLRFWHRLPDGISDSCLESHRSDEEVPPQAANTSVL